MSVNINIIIFYNLYSKYPKKPYNYITNINLKMETIFMKIQLNLSKI